MRESILCATLTILTAAPVTTRAEPASGFNPHAVQVVNTPSQAVPVTVTNGSSQPVPVQVQYDTTRIVQFEVILNSVTGESLMSLTLTTDRPFIVEQISGHCHDNAGIVISVPGGNQPPHLSTTPADGNHYVTTGQAMYLPVATSLPGWGGSFTTPVPARMLIMSTARIDAAFASAQPPGNQCSLIVYGRWAD